jgi:hypothetical protein
MELLINSCGSLQAALGLHDCILASGPASRSIATVLYRLVASIAVLIGASGDFRVGLVVAQACGGLSKGQQFGVTSEVLLAAHEDFPLPTAGTGRATGRGCRSGFIDDFP